MMIRAQRLALVAMALVGWFAASHADAQGATDSDEHFHYLHFEIERPDAELQYPDGPPVVESGDSNADGGPSSSEGAPEPADAGDVAAETVEPEVEPEPVDVASFDLSGWMWLNYSIQPWRETALGKYGNFVFNQLQLTGRAKWGGFSMRFEIRFFSFMFILRQGWFQYEWKDNAIQVGHLNVSWGRHLFSSHSWWFTLGWYSTVEDDYDYGVRYTKDTDRYRLDVGYYFRDQIGFFDPSWRWDSDLTPLGEQQNREVSSTSIRGVYKLPHRRAGLRSEFGAVVQAGLLPNVATGDLGYRWLAQVMYNGKYNGWIPIVQATRHEFRPKNPAEIDGVPVDNDVVRVSQFAGYHDVAAKYWLCNFNLAKEIPFQRKFFTALVPYVEYSLFLKDAAQLPDSHLITVGLQVHLGPVWLWLDILTGKNATYLNDSLANSGLATGSNRPDRWENQTNLQIQYYF